MPSFVPLRLLLTIIARPRRVAAIRLAERVDAQLKELSKSNAVFRNPESGKRYRAGYRIMSDSSSDRGSSAAVLFATTGYLVSWIAADPTALDDATHIVLDEAHERSVDMDLLLLLVRRRLERERMTGVDSGLKVVIMSATLDVGLHGLYFERFFSRRPGIPDPLAPIDVTQRRYPVERIFLESLLTHPLTSEAFAAIDRDLQNAYVETYATPMEPWAAPGELQRTLSKFAVAVSGTTGSNYLAPHIDDEGLKLGVALAFHFGEIPFQKVLPGSIPFEEILGEPKKSTSILVFLPGENEILAFLESLEEAMTYYVDPTEWERIRTHVLHSSTAKEEQDKAFLPVDRSKGQVKIVLATNIAESSVTMPDAEYVIDFGLRRAMEFNAQRGMQQLSLGWSKLSKDSFFAPISHACLPPLRCL